MPSDPEEFTVKPSVAKSMLTIRSLVCALLFLGWTLGGAAETQESPMLDYLDGKMVDIGAQMQNARMRLRKDFAGVDPDVPADAQTPVILCCMANLETIHDRLLLLRAGMEQMLEFYRGQHNSTAVSILGQMSTRLDQLTTGMVYFARAPTEAQAFDALNGLIRPWNEFRNGVRTLRSCCPLPLAVPEDPPEDGEPAQKNEKKRKKDKNKKDKKKTAD